jgi:hypothetical protein
VKFNNEPSNNFPNNSLRLSTKLQAPITQQRPFSNYNKFQADNNIEAPPMNKAMVTDHTTKLGSKPLLSNNTQINQVGQINHLNNPMFMSQNQLNQPQFPLQNMNQNANNVTSVYNNNIFAPKSFKNVDEAEMHLNSQPPINQQYMMQHQQSNPVFNPPYLNQLQQNQFQPNYPTNWRVENNRNCIMMSTCSI